MRKLFCLKLFLLVCLLCTSCKGSAWVNVRTFGAKGDGRADDTKAIREAFSSLAKVGGTIYFPKGVYITEVIDIRPEKGMTVIVRGDGQESIVKLKRGANKPVSIFFCEIPGVKLRFSDLTINGSSVERVRAWRTTGEKQIEVDHQVNGIFAYNVQELTVKNCFISQVHGDGIACYSAEHFTANRNVVSDVSGTGIKGHRVVFMEVTHNNISDCGLLSNAYLLDGKAKRFDDNAPFTKFGDGIEAASKHLKASYNTIANPGRCGIVHDLASDLNFSGSSAIVSNNSITINSPKINSNNPPAGMWFEQTAKVVVNDNTITMLNSKNVLTSAIRFYDITESITCFDNMILADNYSKLGDNAIGLFEPRTKQVKLTGNIIRGKFKSGIVVSYENALSGIANLIIYKNVISGNGFINEGIWISVLGSKRFPDLTDISSNNIQGMKIAPYNLSYHGQIKPKKNRSILNLKNNTTDPAFLDAKIETPQDVQINTN
jgi:nitrous oxidase accessory protein NosD